MWNLKDNIFSYFGRYEKEIDPNKDINNKGTLERFNESMAEEFDVVYAPLITNLFDNVLNPVTNLEVYLDCLLEQLGGEEVIISLDLTIQRNLVKYIHDYYRVKGTILGYQLLLSLISLEGVFVEFDNDFTFDGDTTILDDDVRFLDSGACNDCLEYEITVNRITGAGDLTEAETTAIKNIIKFNQPINVKIRTLIDGNSGAPIELGDFDPVAYNVDYFTSN